MFVHKEHRLWLKASFATTVCEIEPLGLCQYCIFVKVNLELPSTVPCSFLFKDLIRSLLSLRELLAYLELIAVPVANES